MGSNANSRSSGRIKSNRVFKVKLCLTLALLGLAAHRARAQEPDQEALPDIEAKTYDVSVLRHSKSDKVYLFKDPSDAEPPLGQILLLKKNDASVMAVRVLKNYKDKKEFAAKAIKKYGLTQSLAENDEFHALEKISDVTPPPLTKQDTRDLKELEKEPEKPLEADPNIPAYDPELDAGTSPAPQDTAPHKNSTNELMPSAADEDAPTDGTDEVADDVEPFSRYHNAVTLGFGLLRNNNISNGVPGGTIYPAGFGLRYAYTFKDRLAFKSKNVQDSLSAEAGFYYYHLSGYDSSSDNYSIMPLVGTLRYNLHFSTTFGVYVYAGVMDNIVVTGTNTDPASLQNLGGIMPAVGVGLNFGIGPNWNLRVDLGFDVLGLGLMLSF